MFRGKSILSVVGALLLNIVAVCHAHVPVPPSVLDPKTVAEAWNVLRLSTDNIARLLTENRLSEIPDQASLCTPALRFLPARAEGAPASKRQAAVEAMRASVAIASLAQAGMAGDKATAEAMFESLREHLRLLADGYDRAAVQADIFACPMHPDCVSSDPQVPCPKCGMKSLQRRIPYSFVYLPAGEPTIRLEASADGDLRPGVERRVTIHLTDGNGLPVAVEDLLVMHTQPIHLLIVDPGLRDYHHEHPLPADKPGEYVFSFTPALDSNYRIFADVVPVSTGVQEYPFANLAGGKAVSGAGQVTAPDNFSAQSSGLNFVLSNTDGSMGQIRAGRLCGLKIDVSDAATGRPCGTLEPVMNAFAHLVGFYGDGRTVVHLHPIGNEIADPAARGGPGLEFKFYPPKAGFIRLYCQVQIGGAASLRPIRPQRISLVTAYPLVRFASCLPGKPAHAYMAFA